MEIGNYEIGGVKLWTKENNFYIQTYYHLIKIQVWQFGEPVFIDQKIVNSTGKEARDSVWRFQSVSDAFPIVQDIGEYIEEQVS